MNMFVSLINGSTLLGGYPMSWVQITYGTSLMIFFNKKCQGCYKYKICLEIHQESTNSIVAFYHTLKNLVDVLSDVDFMINEVELTIQIVR